MKTDRTIYYQINEDIYDFRSNEFGNKYSRDSILEEKGKYLDRETIINREFKKQTIKSDSIQKILINDFENMMNHKLEF